MVIYTRMVQSCIFSCSRCFLNRQIHETFYRIDSPLKCFRLWLRIRRKIRICAVNCSNATKNSEIPGKLIICEVHICSRSKTRGENLATLSLSYTVAKQQFYTIPFGCLFSQPSPPPTTVVICETSMNFDTAPTPPHHSGCL